jgi:hypothetical protein
VELCERGRVEQRLTGHLCSIFLLNALAINDLLADWQE